MSEAEKKNSTDKEKLQVSDFMQPVPDEEAEKVNYPYPKAVGFIVTNEFCERFSYYGMRTILVIYLSDKLGYSEDSATIIYHVFTMFVYFFPIFGAMIADSWLGRFRTIFYLSIVYSLGNILLSLTAMPPLSIPPRAFTIIGLLLVAIGTGGIKPCVSAFGGDQFKLPHQERQLAAFFSLFYFAINAGSLISTFVTPILRLDVKCFPEYAEEDSDGDCYPLAFGVPGILMIVSIVVLIAGKSLYVIKKPSGNVMLEVSKCIGHAVARRHKMKKHEKRDHWLDYADDKFDRTLIEDVKVLLKVLLLFIPLPVFWALFDQQGSRWTFQASRMNGAMGSFILKPDQMQVVNPLLILLFIPLFEVAIYPALKWCRIVTKPLHKMILGGLLAAVAFIISAIVELELEKTYPVLPSDGYSQMRLYNGYPCDLNVSTTMIDEGQFTLNALNVYENKFVPVTGNKTFFYEINANSNKHCPQLKETLRGSWDLEENKAISFFLKDKLDRFYDDSDKASNGLPAVRALIYDKRGEPFKELRFVDASTSIEEFRIKDGSYERKGAKPMVYNIYYGNTKIAQQEYQLGGVYVLILDFQNQDKFEVGTAIIAPPNSVHMMWLLPQYIIITMGEVMFSVTGLEFSFTQAPASMKSVLTAGWLLTVAFGNLIVVIVAETKGFDSQANEFFLFAGLMVVDMVIFWLMTLRYKYVGEEVSDKQVDELALPEKKGIDNTVFKEDEDQKDKNK